MTEKITDAVVEQLKKHLQKQMDGINKKLDRINNRISNVEAYMELKTMIDHFEFLTEKFDDSMNSDVLNPPQTLKKPQTGRGRRPGQ